MRIFDMYAKGKIAQSELLAKAEKNPVVKRELRAQTGEVLSEDELGNISAGFTHITGPTTFHSGTPGNDQLGGSAGNDIIFAGSGDDIVGGGNGQDLLYGNDGNDYLNGNNGDDFLCGGAGNDNLYGGQGNDMFIFGTNDGTDYIFDFEKGNDGINLVGATSIEDFSVSYSHGDTVITYGDTTINIRNVTLTAEEIWASVQETKNIL